jgi:subtilisin family serine protease
LKTVSVTVNGDNTAEFDEAFRLNLSTTSNYAVDPGEATILNDDGFLSDGGVYPDDPSFREQWLLHNTAQTDGIYDADIDAPAAWSITTGSMATVVAVLDSGVDYTHPDLYLNIWLNQAEIPTGLATNLTDTDSDGLITFRDLNDVANMSSVSDSNGNGYIDGGDLLNDPTWENGLDEDNNGRLDDLVGWDFYGNDNEPMPLNAHGTGMSTTIGAITNNGSGTAGVNWAVSVMPVRIHVNNSDNSVARRDIGRPRCRAVSSRWPTRCHIR